MWKEGAPKCGSMHLTERWTDGRTEHPKVGACVRQNGQGKTKVHEKLDNTLPHPLFLRNMLKELRHC